MPIVGIDYVQLAMPCGEEDRARRFYSGRREVGQFTAIGDPPLPLWLLIKGVDRTRRIPSPASP